MSALFQDINLALSNTYSGWILWNLFLAFIPLVLSYWLFRWSSKPRTGTWWFGVGIFLVFLPNAPYVLTDIIHLIRGVSSGVISTWVVALIFIPIHVFAILLGFEAYVVSLINQGFFLKKQGLGKNIIWAELVVHLLCAIGIYLGRFIRLNSWDIVTAPGNVFVSTLNTLTARRPLLIIFITFIILTILYWVMKQITIGLKLRARYARMGDDGLD